MNSIGDWPPPASAVTGSWLDLLLALGDTFHLEDLSYRGGPRTYGKSISLCAPGMFVERLSRLAASAGGTMVSINPWRARLSPICPCGRVKRKSRSERWHSCEQCGASAQRDLFGAFLARYVHPDSSLLNVGQAQAAWPAVEPLLQAAYEQAIKNQPGVWQEPACRLWSASRGRSEGDAGRLRKGCVVDSLGR